jgi:hypothetical protein
MSYEKPWKRLPCINAYKDTPVNKVAQRTIRARQKERKTASLFESDGVLNSKS